MLKILLSSLIVLTLTGHSPVIADDHGKIRVYKLNKKDQLVRQRWGNKIRPINCHNLKKPREVHRFAQTGYEFCQIFSARNCVAGSEVLAMWDGNKYRIKGVEIDTEQPQLYLYRGSKWLLDPEKNVEITSIRCQYAN